MLGADLSEVSIGSQCVLWARFQPSTSYVLLILQELTEEKIMEYSASVLNHLQMMFVPAVNDKNGKSVILICNGYLAPSMTFTVQ